MDEWSDFFINQNNLPKIGVVRVLEEALEVIQQSREITKAIRKAKKE